jgi:hypothetical protein
MGGDNFSPNVYSKALWNMFNPGFSNVAGQFNALTGATGYGVPQAPTMPSMYGVLTGAGSYGIPGYDIPTYGTYGYSVPSTSSIMPTTDWWKGLSPEVKAGAWAPFGEGQKSLMETLGGSGQGGSARGGYSGATGAALGQYMADATPAYAMNLWNMSSPGMMAGWQAQLGQNQYLAGLQNQQAQWGAQAQLGENQWLAQQQLARNQLRYQNALTERQTDYQNQLNQLQQNYQGAMTGWQMPWQMAMNYNNLAPSGAYHSDSGGTMNSVLGAATSIGGPLAMGYGMSGMGKGRTPNMGQNIQTYNM